MNNFGKRAKDANLNYLGLGNVAQAYWNLSPAELVEETIMSQTGTLNDTGALAVDTGEFTGRSPKDRFPFIFTEVAEVALGEGKGAVVAFPAADRWPVATPHDPAGAEGIDDHSGEGRYIGKRMGPVAELAEARQFDGQVGMAGQVEDRAEGGLIHARFGAAEMLDDDG